MSVKKRKMKNSLREAQTIGAAAKKIQITFVLDASPNSEVYLAGDFNEWKQEPMTYDKKSGLFAKVKRLLPGRYEYKFVVNGEWMIDEKCEDFSYNDRGSMNSLVIVDP